MKEKQVLLAVSKLRTAMYFVLEMGLFFKQVFSFYHQQHFDSVIIGIADSATNGKASRELDGKSRRNRL